MPRKSVHITPAPSGGWNVKSGGASRAAANFDKKVEAISRDARSAKIGALNSSSTIRTGELLNPTATVAIRILQPANKMATYKIAHIREQGQDMIIVPLDSSFDYKLEAEQNAFIAALQWCARSAGLAGTVVPVWRSGSNQRFIAPSNWHAFFRTLPYGQSIANLNKELTCS